MSPPKKAARKPARPARQPAHHAHHRSAAEPPVTVDPVWLLKAIGASLALAFVLGYAVLCVVFARTQWQLVLHPVRVENRGPADFGLDAQPVRFAVDGSGQPQLRGWWIPAAGPAKAAVLMLPAGTGNASGLLPRAAGFHAANFNVLLFDYRGFGASEGRHPAEASMTEDSEHALGYLESGHGTPSSSVVVYGAGAGASLAVRLCHEHRDIPALVLESADGDFVERASRDERSKTLPFHLLFHEDFPLAAPLHDLSTAKLLISHTGSQAPAVYHQAASPKMTLDLPNGSQDSLFGEALDRFLATYAPQIATHEDLPAR